MPKATSGGGLLELVWVVKRLHTASVQKYISLTTHIMGLNRKLDAEGVRHANADSKTHALHVLGRQKRRDVNWIAEDAQAENPANEFRLRSDGLGLGNGIYYVGFGTSERPAEGKEFERHLSAINWDRRFQFAQMKRGDKVATVRRKRTSPACREMVVNLSPWQMQFINDELQRWEVMGVSVEKRKEMLLAFLEPLRAAVVSDFAASTGLDVPGSYLHLDSTRVHVGVIYSVVGADNKMLGKNPPCIGAYTVASCRAAQVGVQPSNAWLANNLKRFGERHGVDAEPVDLRVHRILDEQFTRQVDQMAKVDPTASKRYEQAKEYYRNWKAKRRHEVVMRSATAQRIGWSVLQMAMPLFPPQVRTAISICRTAVQAFRVLSVAIEAAQSSARDTAPAPQISKVLAQPK